jgi:Ca2+-transporting ATPase
MQQPTASPAASPWHTTTVDDVVIGLHSDVKRGLAAAEVVLRQQRDGANALVIAAPTPWFVVLLHQFKSMMVLLLVVATIAAYAMGEVLNGSAVLIVIVINAGVGFAVEQKAARTLNALRELRVRTATVVRDGTQSSVEASTLVVGDLVLLEAGARVPADGRVVDAVSLSVDEAALTGESVPVAKVTAAMSDPGAVLADQLNMVHSTTTVTGGRGHMLVTAIGAATEIGHIKSLLADEADRDTPLEKQLARLGRGMVVMAALLIVVIVAIGWVRGHDLRTMIELGVALAVAAVPEGLAAVSTMTLALGMQRMAKRGALVRRLSAVETLGATTVICSDKTGTLTKNEMTLRALTLADSRVVDITGSGYGTVGTLAVAGAPITTGDAALLLALRAGVLCNDAHLEKKQDLTTVLGDPTEGALLVAAEKAGLVLATVTSSSPRLAEQPFTSETQRMVTVHGSAAGDEEVFVKGAPVVVFAACGFSPEDQARWDQANTALAAKAWRVLAIAHKRVPTGAHSAAIDVDSGLAFVGLVALEDPLRDEARAAIATCQTAGIRTVMITGDQVTTAAAIAHQLGIDIDDSGSPRATRRGGDLANLDEAGWLTTVKSAAVFARVTAEQKVQIVKSLQRAGDVVAMTGDGVNDAPALKAADIGVAMGKKGSAVARDTSAMIITDDNFATIVVAVEQGRVIYANIQKFILYLFSCNLAELLTVFVSIMVGWPVPVLALQLLWLNMITDVLPAFALALDTAAPDMMKRSPRSPKASIVNKVMLAAILWQGAVLAAATLAAFAIGRRWFSSDELVPTTMAFMTLALSQILHAFTARSLRSSLFVDLFSNRWLWGAVAACLALQVAAVEIPLLRTTLHTASLSWSSWGVVVGCSVVPLVVSELVKLVVRGLAKHPVAAAA